MVELLLHAWDVATALGRSVTVSEEVTTYVLRIAEHVLPPQDLHSAAAPVADSAADAHMLDLHAGTGRAADAGLGVWMDKVGNALVDGGNPFTSRTAVAGDGSEATRVT